MSGVAEDVSMLKLAIYGDVNTNTIGLKTRVDKTEERIDKVEKDSADVLNQIKGAVSTLKVFGAVAIGFFTIVASICEIYRAISH